MIFAQIRDQDVSEALETELSITTDKKWYRRLIIVKLSVEKYSVNQLSQMFALSPATVRRYVHAFNEGGIENLSPKKSSGRPGKISEWTRADWDGLLAQAPNQYEKLDSCSRQWTYKRIQLYFSQYHGLDVSFGCIYNSLRKTGRRTGRSKLRVGSPDPDYQPKRKSVEKLRCLPSRGN